MCIHPPAKNSSTAKNETKYNEYLLIYELRFTLSEGMNKIGKACHRNNREAWIYWATDVVGWDLLTPAAR